MPTVALVLGSGGARGNAHIGVIQVLQEQGFDIVSISGCSMGAAVGGMFAAGKLDEFSEWMTGLSRFDVLRLVDMSLLSMGIVRGEKVFSKLHDMVGDVLIEELPIRYTAVATDLVKQQEVWFQSGILMDAIRASVAVPGLIMPVRDEHRFLVDGGLLNPVPISPTVADQADLILAVNLNAQTHHRRSVQRPDLNRDGTSDHWVYPEAGDVPKLVGNHLKWNKVDMIDRCFETMQATLAKYKSAGYDADVEINIDSSSCGSQEFFRAQELIKVGRTATLQALQFESLV
ncbi:MAG: alpha/beta hydrolase [Gammaproteobacteria bacterium]|jgi:NTE family protein|nr:alpha/beta hydrolase [Gammaproteobacteria bacterium]MCP4880758.1 alpha/beta hydrolase [Gammaproteobacteria bacterium]MDP6166767.1 patatin-like phospholipase family protein [Gammaproteobacteria bacterium]